MKHEIDPEVWGEYGEPMAKAIQTCVHCGFCLPTCPTYNELGQEADSPRGRIFLMKEVLEKNAEFEEVKPHVDQCLGCLACETACPSGVKYGELLSPFRQKLASEHKRKGWESLKHWLVFQSLPYPGRFRWALRMGALGRLFKPLVPKAMKPMVDMVPAKLPKPVKLKNFYPVDGKAQGRVALLAGCAQQVLRPEINLATIRVLNRNGYEVVIPEKQGCCGALGWHAGHPNQGKQFAKQNYEVFGSILKEVDAIITNAAGCGSGLHDYQTILRDSVPAADLQEFVEKCVDITVFLDRIELRQLPEMQKPTRVAYHDACHLLHAQKVKSPPRKLLEQIKGLTLLELPQAGTCCGSAGTYNLDQPEIAAQLGANKAAEILSVSPDVVVTGNIGCLVQVEQHLRKAEEDLPIRVLHTIELLDRVYRNLTI